MKVKEFKRKKLKKCILTHLARVLILVAIISLWELSARNGFINEFLFSKPSSIYKLFASYITNGSLFTHLGVSTYETIIGLVVGTALGLIAGTFLWFFQGIAKILDPFLVVLNALPKTALAPIFIIWAGTGTKGIVTVAISISLIITIISIYSYFNNVDKEKIKMMKTYGANKLQILSKLVIPSNISNIVDIVKINIGMSWIGVIVGEFIVSRAGIGYLLTYGSQIFKLDLVMMSVGVLAFVAYIMYLLVSILEKIIIKKMYH